MEIFPRKFMQHSDPFSKNNFHICHVDEFANFLSVYVCVYVFCTLCLVAHVPQTINQIVRNIIQIISESLLFKFVMRLMFVRVRIHYLRDSILICVRI